MRMRRMSKNPTEAQIIQEGVEILSAGLLASALPQSLIEEFGITPEESQEAGRRSSPEIQETTGE